MGVMDVVRGWFGGGQDAIHASDPRVHDNLRDEAQFTAAAAERLEYANPDVGPSMDVFSHEIGGEVGFGEARSPKSLVHVGEWQTIDAPDAYWEDVRTIIGQDAAGFHYQIEAISDNGDTQSIQWNGPFATLDDAKGGSHEAVEDMRASWAQYAEQAAAHYQEVDAVETVRSSEWTNHDGLWETRTHIGKSEEGWHFAVESSYQGGDGCFSWSEAHPSRDEAEAALGEDYGRRTEEIERDAEAREDAEIAAFVRREVPRDREGMER